MGHTVGMKFALQLGYWGAQPPANHADLIVAADKAGFDTVFTAEAWGSDAFTPLAWYGALTERIRLSTAVVQLSARTPTATAPSGRHDEGSPSARRVVSAAKIVEPTQHEPSPRAARATSSDCTAAPPATVNMVSSQALRRGSG